MTEKDYAPLTTSAVRLLHDKLYEKRKGAALEIEKQVKDFLNSNQTVQITKVLKVLGEDFASSQNPNTRKGGLIGLAATAIALGKESSLYVNELLKPVLSCFYDQDSRVRYYACEALYNIVKVARGSVLPYFNEIFDGLSKLTADTDQHVKNGTELLDRLIKDVVTESSSFDLVAFIPLLRERVYTRNPFARQFVVSWIAMLDAVPDINMLVLLPEILDGLFQILGDSSQEIRKICEGVLLEFLHGIQRSDNGVNFAGMANILIVHSQSADELIQYTAISWLKEFVHLAERAMLPFASGILGAIMPCLAYDEVSGKLVRDAAKGLNSSLMGLISSEDDKPTPVREIIPEIKLESGDDAGETTEGSNENIVATSDIQLEVSSVITVLCNMLTHTSIKTRIATLRWLCHLLQHIPNKTFRYTEEFFPLLINTLSDPSDEVVLLDLECLAEISSNPAGQVKHSESEDSITLPSPVKQVLDSRHGLNRYFTKFMVNLMQMFETDSQLLDDRGSFIIRQLTLLLNADDIYRSLAEILTHEKDIQFGCIMVQTLNTILLTSTELFELRSQLKDLKSEESCSLFCALYKSWSHSPVATVSLCYLTQNYKHACTLLQSFSELEVTVDFLKEIDKLVQLLESPIFSYLRLQLLDVQANQHLIKSLYGLLMLLPQSEAFKLLRTRLECVPHYHLAPPDERSENKTFVDRPLVAKINFNELMIHFNKVQAKHREFHHHHHTRGHIQF